MGHAFTILWACYTLPRLYCSTALESTDAVEVLRDQTNRDWLAVVAGVDGPTFEDLERRYYLALGHFRGQSRRPLLSGQVAIEAETRKEALQALLQDREERKGQEKVAESNDEVATFVNPRPVDDEWPEALRDLLLGCKPAVSDPACSLHAA